MKAEEVVFQLIEDRYDDVRLIDWTTDEATALADLKFWQEVEPDSTFHIEMGTDWITLKCRGCGTVHCEERFDHYGIHTGYYCDECYEDDSKYPYKRNDYYDYLEAGEYLESEDY